MRLPTLHKRNAVALADLGELHTRAQRTGFVRIVLALALLGTLALLFDVARSAGSRKGGGIPRRNEHGRRRTRYVGKHLGADLARVATTLRGIVSANQSIGLVMFSDTAYELLPPNSPPGALLQFIPFFRPLHYYGATPVFAQSPWDTFRGGQKVGAQACRWRARR